MSEEPKRRRGNEPPADSAPQKPKKPSGHQFELMRRANLAKQQEADRLRAGYFAAKIARAPAVPGPPERAHLRMLERLERQACDIENDPGLSEEDRRKAMNDTAHAMAKISANAECEREAEEHEREYNRRIDEHKVKKRALQMAMKKHTCVECRRKMTEGDAEQ
jgi:hypothetical protein